MKVKDANNLIFTCIQDEKVTMKIDCANTAIGIHCEFRPAIESDYVEIGNAGVLIFKVTQQTKLIMQFDFSGDANGRYICEFSPIENDPEGIFHHRVRQEFGAKRRKREFRFQI